MVRKRRNKILTIQNDDGEWLTESNDLKNWIVSFYANLYCDYYDNVPFIISNAFPELSVADSERIGRMVSPLEIKEVVFAMGSLKAPGRDGIQAVFYQQHWQKVGVYLYNLVQNIFKNPTLVSDINETLLVLIPKIEPVSSLKHMRTINLCNVSYKVVTKILAKRLQTLMAKLVRPTQTSFVPGRHSSDNIIITQEVIHSIRNKKGGKGWMAIKIDLEKVYDRLKWSFINDTLMDIGFPSHITNLIYGCISSARMRVLWNGDELEEFTPSRGIRQGDPISPYLFVLCIEHLSQLIDAAVEHGFWKPIHLKRDALEISHLYFVDDLILFAEASLEQAVIINNCLNAFCDSSGQKVSQDKTRVFFSRNVGNNVRTIISEALNLSRTDDLGKYLGIPLHHSRVSESTFNNIIDKMNTNLNSWKASSLSLAGRNTLVKSVLSSIPSYTMQTAFLPKATCNAIDKKCRNFFWGDTNQTRKIHLVSWKKVCEPKKSGGLGIHRASTLNHSFMTKVGWGLIENKNALWARVLRSKYGSENDIIPKVERKQSSSNLWKGICASWDIVESNHIWCIRDDSTIDFWKHN
ncbi:LINE-1 retrotransposable element ORF2 protein [Arachis hypogaea]|nr:LINE-1 retrotransposable element ORF2 protein [Arachis hypogaea]